ncbi:MAG TPA: hypothetical protein PK629_01585 [Oscillospiraceae bacterium]|nr:hypothetical protein [Oscillospiraceae bacterium]HPF55240.1 hypothetical protein [Clostridiales bacterium]HPK35270.1 hypothetical protein [Oscillospiraceae bacterium]HPR75463.1 hypothetical protein [Oscillospiraceae bacterium]
MDNRRIYEQLREVELALRSAYNRFEQLCEPDLVESEIFLIKCLEAKRNHLIREARIIDAETENAGTGKVVSEAAKTAENGATAGAITPGENFHIGREVKWRN